MAKRKPRSRARSAPTPFNPLSGQPWWVQALAVVGAPVAGLGWVMYFLLGSFNAQLMSMNQAISAHVATSSATMDLIRKHLDDEVQQRWVQIGIEQRTCLNTSKSDGDRIACAGLVRGQ